MNIRCQLFDIYSDLPRCCIAWLCGCSEQHVKNKIGSFHLEPRRRIRNPGSQNHIQIGQIKLNYEDYLKYWITTSWKRSFSGHWVSDPGSVNLNRLILFEMAGPTSLTVLHLNFNKDDLRRCNLRAVTRSEYKAAQDSIQVSSV